MNRTTRWCLFYIIRRTSFRCLALALCAVTGILCLLIVYQNCLFPNHLDSDSSLVSKSINIRVHEVSTIKQKVLSIEELDEIKFRKKVKVNEIHSLSCLNIPFKPSPPEQLQETFAWQMMEPEDTNCYIFSAYYEPRTRPPAVRIIGIATNAMSIKYCQIWYADVTTAEVVQAETVVLPESHDKKYRAVFYICYLKERTRIPYAVSLVKKPCQAPNNILRIVNNNFSKPHDTKFTVCVTPLNMHFDNYDQLIEIMEVNQMFGAERFTFYNFSTGYRVDGYLKQYEADGIANIIPWNIPVMVDVWPVDPKVIPEIHYFGQVAALNDCLYRNMFHSQFIVFTDLDEIIVPRAHDSWSAMLAHVTSDWQESLLASNARQFFPGCYLVQNIFFRVDGDDIPTKNIDAIPKSLKLLTLSKLTRVGGVYPWHVRSKYIVWSKVPTSVAVHGVYQFINDLEVRTVEVKKEDALVHHYRRWLEQVESGTDFVTDDRMLRFSEQIILRVLRRKQKVELQ